jgi:hypothetical protein
MNGCLDERASQPETGKRGFINSVCSREPAMKDHRTPAILSRSFGVLTGLLLCAGIFLVPSGSFAGPTNPTVRVTLRICVTEGGNPIDLKPTLFNSPSRVKERDGDCYTTGWINLDPSLMYFVAATKPDLSGFAYESVIVTAADAGKTILIDLPVQSRDKTPTTIFDICLSSNNEQLTLTDVKSRDGNPIVVSNATNSRCRKITTASSSDVKLDLIAAVPLASAGVGRWAVLGVAVLLILSASGLVLTVWVFNGLRDLTSTTATTQQIEQIAGQLTGLETIVRELSVSPTPPLHVAAEQTPNARAHGDGSGASSTDSGATSPSIQAEEEKLSPAAFSFQFEVQGSNAQQDAIAVAREQYQRFARGEVVPHFYLMPSGASAANNMVEDLVVELHERSNGTYVGFRTGAADDEAWIFPMPGLHFTTEAFKPVFPDLTAESYASGSFDPRLLVRKAEGRWIPT